MSELQIDILLLFIISFSATFLAYILYFEYKKIKHLAYVKSVISLKDEDDESILENKSAKNSASWDYKLHIALLHAGFNSSIAVFLLIFVVFVGSVGELFSLFLESSSGYIFGLPIGVMLFYIILKGIIKKRKKEFNKALATAISVLVKMMQNGIGFEQALHKSVDVSSSKLFKKMFENFFQEKNAIGEIEAFTNMNDYVDSKELRIFALAIKIGRASGGQFSNTLEKVETTITYRKKMQEKVDVVTREGSVGSYAVIAVAILLYFMLDSNFDGRLNEYFMHSEWGRFQLLGISFWVFTGMIVNKMITRIER